MWRCSSVVEQATHNRCVASSILAIATADETASNCKFFEVRSGVFAN